MSWAEAGDKAVAEMAVSRASVMALALMYVMDYLRFGHDEDTNTPPRSKVPIAAARPRLCYWHVADNPTAPAFVRYERASAARSRMSQSGPRDPAFNSV